MTRDHILSTVKKYLVDAVEDLGGIELDTSMSMKDLGANSLDIVEVVSRTMRELKIKVPRAELAKLTNVDGLVDLLYEVSRAQGEGRVIADFRDRVVLVTGGTMGLGLATALAFAERGARCWLTYRWGSADEDEVRARFAAIGAPEPRLVLADAACDDDTDALLAQIRACHAGVDVFVSNVSGAPVVNSLDDYAPRALFKSIEYSAWPLVAYTRCIKTLFGRYPRYVVGMSSTGVDGFSVGYDYVAASKAVLETLCRYLNYRLFDEDIRINVVRSRGVRTASFDAHFGDDFSEFARRFTRERHFMQADEVADAVVALCSGLMDGVSGQVLTVDRGTTFFDNLMRLYDEREELAL